MERGTVKWFDDNKGYGFVEQDVGDDLFVHYSDIQQEGYKTLREGQEVEFDIEETEKGLAAKNVSIVGGDEGADEAGDEESDDEEPQADFESDFENPESETEFEGESLEDSMNLGSEDQF